MSPRIPPRKITSRTSRTATRKNTYGNEVEKSTRKSLTRRQKEILRMIESHIKRTGMPPTRTDICEYFGFRSPTAADDHLKALARKGAIELLPGTSRGIRVMFPSDSVPAGTSSSRSGGRSGNLANSPTAHYNNLPIIGRVAAGEPIMSDEHIEDYCLVDPTVFSPRADFLLRVKGMSMYDAGILDGDLLAVHKTTDIHSNQIIVARVDDEVTVKRFRQRGNIVTLLPANDDFEPIRVDLREQLFVVEGVYAGVLRTEPPN